MWFCVDLIVELIFGLWISETGTIIYVECWKLLLIYRSRWMQETFIELKWIAIFWINRYNSCYIGCLSFVSLLLFLSKHQIKRHSRYACYVKMYGVFAVWLSLYIDHWVCNWWQLQMYGVSSSACFLIYFLIYTPK